MKTIVRILCAALALSALCALASCRKKDTSIPEGYKLAGAAENGGEDKSEAKDYYLYIPASWTVDINNTATSAFVSPSDSASVSVMTWTVSVSDATPEECWETSVTDFKKVYADFKEEGRESIKLDGVDALSVTFSGSLGAGAASDASADTADTATDTIADTAATDAVADSAAQITASADDSADHFRFRQVIAVKDSLVYVITYTNVADRFDEHTQDFSDIVSYFKFK